MSDGFEQQSAEEVKSMTCPECGSNGPFDIRGIAWFRVMPDGSVDAQETDGHIWGNDAPCICVNCAEAGRGSEYIVSDFKKEMEDAQSCDQ